ncbi:MAG TPA: NAD-binding protein [Candidatus Eisenbacteria bacterium]|jgi:Trk K+ transport system NAD-binding subunit|nr:NAD-binding protein [Candidatus Eisenbacteria bacterium]
MSADAEPNGHIILCGLSHLGYRVFELLSHLDEPMTVVTASIPDDWRSEIEAAGISIILGDPNNNQRLEEAGIRRAKAVIIMTEDDLTNVSVALDAKRLNPAIGVVVRLFDQLLAERLEEVFDVRRALSTSSLAAPAFTAAALGEHIIGSFHAGRQPYVIARLVIDEKILGKAETVRELVAGGMIPLLKILKDGTHLTAVAETTLAVGDQLIVLEHPKVEVAEPSKRQRIRETVRRLQENAFVFRRTITSSTFALFIVFLTIIAFSVLIFRIALDLDLVTAVYYVITTVTTVGYGDISLLHAPGAIKLYGCFLMFSGAAFLASMFGILTNYFVEQRFEEMFGMRKVVYSGHIVVVGLGNIGYRIVQSLIAVGQKVVVIVRDDSDELFKPIRDQVPVIVGDARSEGTLHKANYAEGKAIVIVTGDDITNISVGLAAERINRPAKSIVRVFNGELANRVQQSLGILDTVLSTSSVSAPSFVGAALYENLLTAVTLEDKFISLLHRKVTQDSPLVGKWAGAVEHEEKFGILLFKPFDQAEFAPKPPQRPINPGDEFISMHIRKISDRRKLPRP